MKLPTNGEVPATPRQRVAYLLAHYWSNDRPRMARDIGISAHILRDVCRPGKTVPDAQVQFVMRRIGERTTINPAWLETGRGPWQREGGLPGSVVAAQAGPRGPGPGPRAQRLLTLCQEVWHGDGLQMADAAGFDPEWLSGLLGGEEPEPDDECLGLVLLAANDALEGDQIREDWLLRGEGEQYEPRPTDNEAPTGRGPDPAPTPPIPPPAAASPFDVFLAAVRQMDSHGAAVAQLDRRIADIAATNEAFRARMQAMETSMARGPAQRDSIRAELREEVNRAKDGLRREIQADRSSDADALGERFDKLERAVLRVADAATSLATKLDNDRRQLAKLEEWCARLDHAGGERALKLHQESQLTWSEWRKAVQDRDERMARRLEEIEGRLTVYAAARAAPNPAPVDPAPTTVDPVEPDPDPETAPEPEPPPRAKPTREVDLDPEMRTTLLDWWKLPGPHQRLFAAEGDRLVAGKRITKAYREHGIPIITSPNRSPSRFHLVADLRHYARWLARARLAELDGRPGPNHDSWLDYFTEHALPEWRARGILPTDQQGDQD